MSKKKDGGNWAKNGRVLPGKRTKEKRIDQLLKDGTVQVVGEDQLFSAKEINEILASLFSDNQIIDGRVFLEKQSPNGKSVAFYTRNVYHLGGDWSSEKKRIEIGKDFLDFYKSNKEQNVETILLGVYHYYPAGNEVLVLDKENFARYINDLRKETCELQEIKTDRQLLSYFDDLYKTLPKTLYGIQCYKEMFLADDQNKNQSAWEGWYVEYFVKKYLAEHPTDSIVWWSSKKTGDLDFDLKFTHEKNFYGDVKSDNSKKSVQGNKKSNIDMLVKEQNGRLWYVVFEFTPEKDSEHNNETTIWWNKKLGKEKLLSYSTRMKYSVTFQGLNVYEINKFAFDYLKVFYVSPCDGKPREPKYKIPNKMKEYLRIYHCS